MKSSLARRFVAIAALAVCSLAAQAHAATLAFEAFYDPDTGNISISPYDSVTNTPWIGNAELALVDFNSTAGVFVAPGNHPVGSIPGPSFDTANRISWSFLASSVTVSVLNPYDLGNVAQTGLSQGFINTDFKSAAAQGSVLGAFSWGALGGATGAGPVTSTAPVPEPSTIMTLAIGGIAGLGYTARRRLRKQAA
jgi:hypothetical protein